MTTTINRIEKPWLYFIVLFGLWLFTPLFMMIIAVVLLMYSDVIVSQSDWVRNILCRYDGGMDLDDVWYFGTVLFQNKDFAAAS